MLALKYSALLVTLLAVVLLFAGCVDYSADSTATSGTPFVPSESSSVAASGPTQSSGIPQPLPDATESTGQLPHTHSYDVERVDATCTQDGYCRYTCACGDGYLEQTQEAKGHSWGEWTVSVEPTISQAGEKLRICDACGAQEQEILDALTSENGFVILSWSETVGRNEDAHVTIQGKPGVQYSITVYYKSGPSSAAGLEPAVADDQGQVTWEWKVGGRTAAGTYEIVISGDGQTQSIYFTVVV